jgi:4-aminobutyrate aminotransferase-like enzyme/Ser/Thr protein kinase RdoA (MazF antagonist)
MVKSLHPPRLPLERLQAFAAEHYGLSGDWQALEGERDQNFRVSAPAEPPRVFKLCNPDEGEAIIEAQASVLEHIARVDPGIAVPRLFRSRAGQALPRLDHEGRSYDVMLLSYLPGRVIGEQVLGSASLRGLGENLARLGRAMRGFVHGAPAGRRLVWDTQHACDLAPHADGLPADDRALALDILDTHRTRTVPRLAGLRSQIIHGDVHPFNALVAEDGTLSGVIDFGDIVHAPLIQDLANAASDFLFPGRDHAATIFEMVRGYARVTPLEDAEADVMLDMIEVRLLMTALVDSLKAANGIAAQGYFGSFNSRAVPMIRELRDLGRERLQAEIRRAAALPVSTRPSGDVLERRRAAMGRKPYLFYDPPLHIVRGDGVWLQDAAGRRFLDCYNNVPCVGHSHPVVAEAIARQVRVLNTNTRYLTDESIAYAERLIALSHESLGAVIFVNSGSEANDLAWRMAKAWTGNRGGLAMEFAYHGVTEAIDDFSPSNAPEAWHAPHMRLVPPPDDYRGPHRRGESGLAQSYTAMAAKPIAELREAGYGVAAFMVDSAFMTNGVLDVPRGYLSAVVDQVRAAGGLFIADEVQSGFGRMGSAFWGHVHHGVVPDFITIGKPAGNGYPVGAVITRHEILDRFLTHGPFFSTFGGNNVACAAGMAVLDVIRDEGLVANAQAVGGYFREKLGDLMQRHAIIGDVRGVGLALGMELVRDRASREPAAAETRRFLNLLRDQGVLAGGEGQFGNVVKIRPPLVFARDHADLAVQGIDRALSRL